ncbi:MAG: carbamoyltransferase HypF [bacterium]
MYDHPVKQKEENPSSRQGRVKARARLLVKGIVQGVGFRPFVDRFARENHLAGWVLNSSSGVEIEVEGEREDVEKFVRGFPGKAPRRSLITHLDVSYYPPVGYDCFTIRRSIVQPQEFTLISPDLAICPDCLRELQDESDRRAGYPFINCTNCGPRYSIIKDIPYDRSNTTMEKFTMCPECEKEYRDPSDRRFHAQPNACRVCGPRVWMSDLNGSECPNNAVEAAKNALAEGKILAIKGLGGFHLVCDAQNDDAVRMLRTRKKREEKPFALMARSIEDIRSFCFVCEKEELSLTSPTAPIVLLKKKNDSLIAPSVAPKSLHFGVMLPYTPLHHLIMNGPWLALVMTSGNISQEPIVISNEDAVKRLAGIADCFVFHDRDIYTRSDDSIVQVVEGKEALLRRSRGYCPIPISLGEISLEEIPFEPVHSGSSDRQEILACGAELKNTICLTRENNAFVSQYLGDLENLETFRFFEHTVSKMKRILKVDPKIIAYDLHPDYLSTKYALKASGFDLKIPVQHHHAHIASCMVENGLKNEKVIGIAWDGTGYGEDGCVWGGEFLVADYTTFERKAFFSYLPLPGGHMAIREPYRMALSYLYQVFGEKMTDLCLPFLQRIGLERQMAIMEIIRKGINSPLTSSAGRLFESISALLGVRDKNTFEGQAAMDLEYLASSVPNMPDTPDVPGSPGVLDAPDAPHDQGIRPYPYLLHAEGGGGHYRIDVAPMIRQMVHELAGQPHQHYQPHQHHQQSHLHQQKDMAGAAFRFHLTMAEIAAEVCHKIRKEYGIKSVVLSGGVFQNRLLTSLLSKKLLDRGFDCYKHWKVPPNDGGIALGQAVIAHFISNKS